MERKDSPRTSVETAAPARNFSIPLEQRIRAMGGAPAYVTRLKFIEDYEETILTQLGAALRESPDAAARVLARVDLERLNRAIDHHNRYFPIEANLPIDFATGLPRHRGRPFEPLPPWTRERLLEAARTRHF